MTCSEFERVLPECLEGIRTPEQQAHLNSCSACSGLLFDLNAIASQANLLSASDEPSPAVWNALEAQLRSEGIIRSGPVAVPVRARESVFRRWRAAWLVPVAAALVIAAGIKLYHPSNAGDNNPVAKQMPTVTAPVVSPKPSVSAVDDQQLLRTVADRPPAQLARFRADLDQANSFIRDAEQSLRDDPNDAYAQEMLMNAYEQKQMLYELAVDTNSQ